MKFIVPHKGHVPAYLKQHLFVKYPQELNICHESQQA